MPFRGHVVSESTNPVLANTGHTDAPSHGIGSSSCRPWSGTREAAAREPVAVRAFC
jgi:hypothetical protein